MYDSRALNWSKNKIAKIYEYYKLNLNFQLIEYIHIIQVKEDDWSCKKIYIDAIIHNSNLSTRKIVNLLSES